MPYVRVKTKGQVTIPAEFRRGLNLKEGDLLEASVARGGIVLKPKSLKLGITAQDAQKLVDDYRKTTKRKA